MKVRKLILLTLTFTLICGSVAYADSVSQKLKVLVNKKSEEGSDGVVVDNKSYISSQIVTDKLQAILIRDDDRKISIFKPNVHMLTSVGNDIFADVKKGQKVKFNVFTQVDSLKTDISALKLTIANPYGEETLVEQRKSGDSNFPDGKSDFWLTASDVSYTFDIAGPYTLRFWMKPAGESTYQVVSEKTIASK